MNSHVNVEDTPVDVMIQNSVLADAIEPRVVLGVKPMYDAGASAVPSDVVKVTPLQVIRKLDV